ncbi:MAG: EAL domain-containing protein [Lachnospiraceae bacterium]|nr:EAL domain-containing protein [Lachnospiraceae bacterium]
MGRNWVKSVRKSEITDLGKLNRKVLWGYFACCILLSVIGGLAVYGSVKTSIMQEWVVYFGLLYLPLLLSLPFCYSRKYEGMVKYVLFASVALFATYILMLGRQFIYLLYVVPVISLAIVYYDAEFSIIVSVLVLILGVLSLSLNNLYASEKLNRYDSIYVLMYDVLLVVYINFISHLLLSQQRKRMQKIAEEKERFEAIVSVGIRRIFEYDLHKDELMTAHSKAGVYGNERHIAKFSEVAKKFRYVLNEDWDVFDTFLKECEEGKPYYDLQMRLRDRNADYKWFRIRAKMLYSPSGIPLKLIGTMENIDENKREELRRIDENMRDSLTRLYKRYYAGQLIQQFLKKQDCSEYAGLLILDIDHFEILNEKMGKAFGDEILKNIAQDIDEIFYPTDILGRAGGDEFVILMKNIRNITDIERKIKEIQQVIAKTYTGEIMNFESTVSVGASVFPTDGVDFDTLFEKAEKALYYTKNTGKNGYHFYDEEKEEIYSRLLVEEKHEQDEETEKESLLAQEATPDSLIELAFKLIEESKDTDSAINLLIRQVARQMGLDAISISARVGKERKVVYPYQCGMGEYVSEDRAITEYTQQEWNSMLKSLKDAHGLVCVSDTAQLKDDTSRKTALAFGIHAFARCAYYDKGEFAGNVDFLDFNKEHEWSKEEIISIRAVANVISAYLLKMKAYEEASETVERLTGYDSVTGLYKYEKFLELTGEFIEGAPHGKYAIIYADFSNFKIINETYGYETGDKILRDFAETLFVKNDLFIHGSRIFSDNMIALVRVGEMTQEQLVAMMQGISADFTKKIQNEYLDSNLVIDIGICPFQIDGQPVLLKNIISNANLARKEAKLPDRPRCIIYNDSMGDKLKQEVAYANDMETAFKNREFVVYMQPKVDLKKGKIQGAEALVRWKKKDGTIIYPNDFIPVFEKNKTITLLDYYIYTEVCKYLADRVKKGEMPVRISINVSRVHLYSINQFVSYIKNLLRKYQISPEWLEFELTETVFTDKVEDTIELMTQLRELGVKISMDDFGSGYSSLNVLTKLPIDVLKLDKEFLHDFENESEEKIIIPSIIDMAKKLNLSVVCEGVESREQVQFLKSVGCDYAQGYYYSKPIPLEEFDTMLADDNFVKRREGM